MKKILVIIFCLITWGSIGQSLCEFKNQTVKRIVEEYSNRYRLTERNISIQVCLVNLRLNSSGILNYDFNSIPHPSENSDTLDWSRVFVFVKVFAGKYLMEHSKPDFICQLNEHSSYVMFHSNLDYGVGTERNLSKADNKLIEKSGISNYYDYDTWIIHLDNNGLWKVRRSSLDYCKSHELNVIIEEGLKVDY